MTDTTFTDNAPARQMTTAAFASIAQEILGKRGISPEVLSRRTYVGGPAWEHEKAVDRILSGNFKASEEKTLVTAIAEELGIELPKGGLSSAAPRNPMDHARRKTTGTRGRGGNNGTSSASNE